MHHCPPAPAQQRLCLRVGRASKADAHGQAGACHHACVRLRSGGMQKRQQSATYDNGGGWRHSSGGVRRPFWHGGGDGGLRN